MALKRIGILTGGGDCSGLNAVIRAITRSAIIQHDSTVIGIQGGFEGLIFNRSQVLSVKETRDILPQGGTILGTSNKGNPFQYREYDSTGNILINDYSERAIDTVRKLDLDCLFVIGGEGTLLIANRFYEMGLPIIGVPKTIDNDLEGTDYTFGYQTAVQVACDALDRLQTTGRSHQRVMILEVMGRHAGWIAMESGIAGGAHIILIPEIPYHFEKVIEKIRLRAEGGSRFSIIVVSEDAREINGESIKSAFAGQTLQGVDRLGGVGNYLANRLVKEIDLEVRCTVLGHIQRGGTPLAFDRVLGTRLGAFAVEAAAKGQFGNMVCLNTPDCQLLPFKELAGKVRTVPESSQLIKCAEDIGICLGR